MICRPAPHAVGTPLPLAPAAEAAPPSVAAAPRLPVRRGPAAVRMLLERLPPTYRVQLTALMRHLERWREHVLVHPSFLNDEVLEALVGTAVVYLGRIGPCFMREAGRVGPLWVAAAVHMAMYQQLEESEGTWRAQARQFDVVYEAAMLQAHRRGHGTMTVRPYADQVAALRPDALYELPPPLDGLGRALLFHQVLNSTLPPYEVVGEATSDAVCVPTAAERGIWSRWLDLTTLPSAAVNVHFGPFVHHAQAHALARSWLHLVRFADATGYHDPYYRERRRPSPGPVVERRFLHAISHDLQVSEAEQQAACEVVRAWCEAPEAGGTIDADVEVFAGYLVKTLAPAAVRRSGWRAEPATPMEPPAPRPEMRRAQTAAVPQAPPPRPQKSLLRSQSTSLVPAPPLPPSLGAGS